jgi:hypothetical protein
MLHLVQNETEFWLPGRQNSVSSERFCQVWVQYFHIFDKKTGFFSLKTKTEF